MVPMQFDRQKLRETVHFVIAKCDRKELGAVKLNKVLYYADMIAYAVDGVPVTAASYKKRPFGPACDEILFALRELHREGKIEISTENYFGFAKKEYTPTAAYVRERLSERDAKLLEEMIDFVCYQNTAKAISDFSHNASWDMVSFGEVIPYLASYSLFPNQPDIESLEWAEEEGEVVAREGPKAPALDTSNYPAFRSRILAALGQ